MPPFNMERPRHTEAPSQRMVRFIIDQCEGSGPITVPTVIRDYLRPHSQAHTLRIFIPGFGCPILPGGRTYFDSVEGILARYEDGASTYISFTMPGSTRELSVQDQRTHKEQLHAAALAQVLGTQQEWYKNMTSVEFHLYSRGARVGLSALTHPAFYPRLGELPKSTNTSVILHMPAFDLNQAVFDRIKLLQLLHQRMGHSINRLPRFVKELAPRDLALFGFITDPEGYFSQAASHNDLVALAHHAAELTSGYDYTPALELLTRQRVPVHGIFGALDKMVASDAEEIFRRDLGRMGNKGKSVFLEASSHTEHLRSPLRLAEVIHSLTH